MKFTVPMDAYISGSQSEFVSAVTRGDEVQIAEVLKFTQNDMSGYWTRVGRATISIELDGCLDIADGAIEDIKSKRRRILQQLHDLDRQMENLKSIGAKR